jgi:hypothetical protein
MCATADVGHAQIPTYSRQTWKDLRSALGARECQQPVRPTINARLEMTLDY